jgi:hypothetical protein
MCPTLSMSKLIAASLTAVGLLLSLGVTAHAGGTGGGGGTGIELGSGEFLLLDMYLNNSRYEDNSVASPLVNLKNLEIQQDVIRFDFWGTQKRNGNVLIPSKWGHLTDQPHFSEIMNHLAQWERTSPIITKIIAYALEHSSFYIVKDLPVLTDFADEKPVIYNAGKTASKKIEETYAVDLMGQKLPKDSKLIPIAVYDPTLNGFVINEKAFSRLGYISQQFIFLKEALRAIQHSSEVSGVLQISNREIQTMSYRILMTSPENSESLDQLTSYGSGLQNVIFSVNAAIANVSPALNSLCMAVKEINVTADMNQFADRYCSPSPAKELLDKELCLSGAQLETDYLRTSDAAVHHFTSNIQFEAYRRGETLAMELAFKTGACSSNIQTFLNCVSSPYDFRCQF